MIGNWKTAGAWFGVVFVWLVGLLWGVVVSCGVWCRKGLRHLQGRPNRYSRFHRRFLTDRYRL